MAVSIEKNLFAIRTILSAMTMSYCDKRAASLLPRPTHRDQIYDASKIEDESRPALGRLEKHHVEENFQQCMYPSK